jgi:hypothetical protein
VFGKGTQEWRIGTVHEPSIRTEQWDSIEIGFDKLAQKQSRFYILRIFPHNDAAINY